MQSTSIPGVAQRTGATTYHVELVPRREQSDKRRPILALAPGVGDVDLVVASELMEAGRAVAGGFVTPDRTRRSPRPAAPTWWSRKWRWPTAVTTSSGSSRSIEKIQEPLLLDLEAIARESGAMISAVMLGAIAGPARCRSRPKPSRRRSAPTARRSMPICAASAPALTPRAAAACAPIRRSATGAAASLAELENEVAPCRKRRAVHDRRRAPARRLSGPRLCAALSRSSGADPRRRCKAGGGCSRRRAASRGAHVVRGRDARGASQDRAGAD